MPDYGHKVVNRSIENKGDGWYEVTNIWDVIDKPVKARFKVDNIGSQFIITNIEIDKKQETQTDEE